MTWILDQSGTTTISVIGTEQQMGANNANNGTIVCEVDTSNMQIGDVLQIRVYTVVLATNSFAQAWKGSYQHAQVNNHKVSPPVSVDQEMKLTLNQTAGTARAFSWKILRV
jgi:hypothetical protein